VGNQTTSTLSARITMIDIKPQLRAAGVCLSCHCFVERCFVDTLPTAVKKMTG
jgi:hypothetical protein